LNNSSFSLREWSRNTSGGGGGVESFSGVETFSVVGTVKGVFVVLVFVNLVRVYWYWGDEGFVGDYADMTTLLGLVYVLYLVSSGGVF